MKNIFALSFICYVLMSLFCHSIFAQAKIPTMVMIIRLDDTKDGVTLNEVYMNGIKSEFESSYPNHLVEVFYIRTTSSGSNQKEVIEDIKTRITDRNTVTDLFIGAHGDTKETGSDAPITQLKRLGEISVKAISPSLLELLEPLKDKVAERFNLFLLSCRAYCGNQQDLEAKTEMIYRYFNSKNGKMFGADTNMDLSGIIRHENVLAKLYTRWQQIERKTSLKNHLFTFVVALMSTPYFLMDHSHPLVLYTSVFVAFTWELTLFIYRKEKKSERLNTGRIFELKEGRVESVRSVEFPRDLNLFFNDINTCRYYFR